MERFRPLPPLPGFPQAAFWYTWLAIALVSCFVLALPARAEGVRDPFFSSVPWDQWQSHGKRRQIRWDAEFFPVELSVHQRLLARVRIQIDRDRSEENAPRALAVLIQYRDEDGNVWQTHILPGEPRPEGRGAIPETVVYGNAFVLPGEYEVSVAVCDPATLEYSFVSHRFHAKRISDDPLDFAWRGLPEVEFLPPNADAPDEWFLPSITSRMHLPVATRRPVALDVFVNATPGGKSAASVSAMRRNMSVLIPAVKVISQVELGRGSINIRFVDLVGRRIAFQQDGVRNVDWPRLRTFFATERPGIIDAGSLAGYWKMRNFLFEQIAAAESNTEEGARAVIVLSGPAFFSDQVPLSPAAEQAVRKQCLYYIRYQPPDLFRRWRARPGFHPQIRPVIPLPEDEMEMAARKVNARVFDVTSASDFRRILAAILGQISRM